jgi:hypothetical protein
MKAKGALVFLFAIVVLSRGFAQEIKPVAVSPGSERGVARVSERCPTFSWTAIGWAAGYRVAVFAVKTAEARTYESMALAATPILTQEIKGKALSWTPSEAEGLKDGGLYVWYVQARDTSGNGLWSAGKTFLVELEKTALVGVEERVAKKLRTRGVSADVIAEVSKELKGGAPSGAIARRFALKSSIQISAGLPSSGGGLGGVQTQANEGDANYNVYYGTGAGTSLNSAAFSNSFFGYYAGNQTTSGGANTYAGYYSGAMNTSGHSNTFIGYYSGRFNTEGIRNTFIGYYAGATNTTGNSNTFMGVSAGSMNSTGYSNTFLGREAGCQNSTGCFNTSVGHGAAYNNQTGDGNTFVGYEAGYDNTSGSGTFLGYHAGFHNTSGTYNTFIGHTAGESNTAGVSNTFLGLSAGRNNVSGSQNTFVGYRAGHDNTADYGAFFGYQAGYSNTTGRFNTCLGLSAGYSNISGEGNTFVGYEAGHDNTAGSGTFLGYNAGFKNTTGTYNTFIGHTAGVSNTTGSANTFLGLSAGWSNISGNQNTYVGYTAGFNNTTSFGTFVGYQAGYSNTSGVSNTFLGWGAGFKNTTGGYNTFFGTSTGYNNVTGSRNVFLGYNAGLNEKGSYKLYISSTNATFPLIYGDFSTAIVAINGKLGVGIQAPSYRIQVAGGAYCNGTTWTNASSRSLKENIRDLSVEDAQAALSQLDPVRFNYKAEKFEECLGFIAEDVPELVAVSDRKGLNPMDIVAVLTKVAQEQQKTNDDLKRTICDQQRMIDELRKEIEAIKHR